MKRIYPLLLVILFSCEDYGVELPRYEPKIVIEALIEQGQFPIVYLTVSSRYFEPVDSASLQELVLTTARVSISDGENEEVLTLFRNEDIFPPFFYRGTDLRGEVGKTYHLEVTSQGETYTASTTITAPVDFDSLWYEFSPGSDSLVNVKGVFSDNPEQEDFYRTFTQVQGEDSKYIPVYQSVVWDKFFNGDSFTFTVLKGTESLAEVTNDIFFRVGDTVNIKFCTMDRAHFDFWRTLEREVYLTGNPFSSAGNEIMSNIEGTREALGVFGGYGVTYRRIIID